MEINIIPIGAGTSISSYIADAIRVLEAEGMKYQLTSMGTIVEGDLDELLELAKKMHRAVAEKVPRVITTVRIDERKNKPLSMEGKVKSVEEKLRASGG